MPKIPKKPHKPFGARILAWRTAKGLSQSQAAKELEVTVRNLQNWEIAHRGARLSSVEHVLDRLFKDGF